MKIIISIIFIPLICFTKKNNQLPFECIDFYVPEKIQWKPVYDDVIFSVHPIFISDTNSSWAIIFPDSITLINDTIHVNQEAGFPNLCYIIGKLYDDETYVLPASNKVFITYSNNTTLNGVVYQKSTYPIKMVAGAIGKINMPLKWKENQWPFLVDGSLKDIYVHDTVIEDWEKVIDFLNQNYTLRYGNNISDIISNQIDKKYANKLLQNTKENVIGKLVSIDVGPLKVNCHFFGEDEIEFDMDPREIHRCEGIDELEHFMLQLSNLLNKQVILTEENDPEHIYITATPD